MFIIRCFLLVKVAFHEKMVGHSVERASPYEAFGGAIPPVKSRKHQCFHDEAVCDIHAEK